MSWQTVPLCGISKQKQITNCSNRELLSVYLGKGIVPFSSESAKRTNVTSLDLSKYQAVDYGDFVLNNQQAWRGSVGVSKYKGIVSPAYIVLELSDDILTPYANYLFQSRTMVDQYVVCSKGVGDIQRNLYWDYLKRVSVPLPPREEQDQIVRYLDWKVSQINKLINAKKRQIELLQEKRHAIIDKTITNSTGDKLRFCNIFKLSKRLSITKADLKDEGIPCVSYGEVHSKYGFEVNPDVHKLRFVDESYLDSSPNSLLQYGDYVFADTSEDITGSGNFTYLNSNTRTFAGYHTIIARAVLPINHRYVAYFFDSSLYRTQIQKEVNGVKVYSITRSILNRTTINVPDIKTQEQCVQDLDIQCANIDKFIAILQHELNLLPEYRTRLISDVVTGKLDVRDVVVPEYEATPDISSDTDEESEEIVED